MVDCRIGRDRETMGDCLGARIKLVIDRTCCEGADSRDTLCLCVCTYVCMMCVLCGIYIPKDFFFLKNLFFFFKFCQRVLVS